LPARSRKSHGPEAFADRRRRVFALVQEGWSYEAIAEVEDLSRERIRQIIKEALEGREREPSGDHQRLQLARLDPALRLAAEQVAAGDLKAIERLIRVLNQIDKYQAAAAKPEMRMMLSPEEQNDARERILAKLSMVDERRAAYAKDPPPGADRNLGVDEAPEESDDSVSKFFQR
jgi:Sigma-70, region 4